MIFQKLKFSFILEVKAYEYLDYHSDSYSSCWDCYEVCDAIVTCKRIKDLSDIEMLQQSLDDSDVKPELTD